MAILQTQPQPDLRRIAGANTPHHLEHQLLDADESVRRRAAQALGTRLSSVPLLIERLGQEPQKGVRTAILESLLQLQSDDVVTGLLPLLRCGDVPIRNSVIALLQQMPKRVAPHIRALLDNRSPASRIFSIQIIEALRHPQANAWLIDLLETDPHEDVCARAIDLLGAVGDHRAVPALRAIKQRFPDKPVIQFSADVALGQIE